MEEHLPLAAVVSLILIGDVCDDGAPYQMVCALEMWVLEVVAIIVVQHETIPLVSQNQGERFCHGWCEHICPEPLLTDVIFEKRPK